MTKFREVRTRTIVNEHGEVLVREERQTTTDSHIKEKFLVLFCRAGVYLGETLLRANSYRLFLWLSASISSGNNIVIDIPAIAQHLKMSRSACYRALKELTLHNILLVVSNQQNERCYKLNSRVGWYGKLSDRPQDLTGIRLLGGKDKK